MKKIYSTPEVAIVNVELQSMIASSGDYPENDLNMSDAPELDEGTTSGNLSRGSSIWDDEY